MLKTTVNLKTLNDIKVISEKFTLIPDDNRRLMNLCGRFDEHLRQIEKRLGVEIYNRGNQFQVMGPDHAVHLAQELLLKLYDETLKTPDLSPNHIHLALQEYDHRLNSVAEVIIKAQDAEFVPKDTIHIKSGVIKPRTENQHRYVQNIFDYDINFGIGPAGTGKTYLAVACAVLALETEQVRRILLVRPAVEAGEKLGFLPGDLSQKIDPYLRPLFDALYEMLGFERTLKLIERHVIELAPLAYMRGRTLNDAFVILDEAQNTTIEQMKMFLTRIGFSSKAVITGDITQIDLPKGAPSGLKHVMEVLKGVKGIQFCHFEGCDVIRHPLVQRIIEAYDHFEHLKPGKKM